MANKARVVLTPEFRGSYVNMVSSKEFIDKGKKTGKFAYTCECIFTEESLKKFRIDDGKGGFNEVDINTVLRDLAVDAWPELAAPAPGPGQLSPLQATFAAPSKGWPLKRGDKFADELKAKQKDGEHYRGMRLMSIKSNVSDKTQPPTLSQVVKGNGAKTFNRLVPSDMETAKMLFQGGNYFVAELNIVANVVGGVKFLTPYVNSIRFTREGVKFGNQGGQLMSRFEGVAGGESDHNPMAGMDTEIPF